jgi:hypothetical protein
LMRNKEWWGIHRPFADSVKQWPPNPPEMHPKLLLFLVWADEEGPLELNSACSSKRRELGRKGVLKESGPTGDPHAVSTEPSHTNVATEDEDDPVGQSDTYCWESPARKAFAWLESLALDEEFLSKHLILAVSHWWEILNPERGRKEYPGIRKSVSESSPTSWNLW